MDELIKNRDGKLSLKYGVPIVLGLLVFYMYSRQPQQTSAENSPSSNRETGHPKEIPDDDLVPSSPQIQPLNTTTVQVQQNLEVTEVLEPEANITSDQKEDRTSFLKKTNFLFIQMKEISSGDVSTGMKDFDGILAEEEKAFFGAFQADLPQKNEKIRINLRFTRGFDRQNGGTCFAVKDTLRQEVTEFFEDRDLKILRNGEVGYLLIRLKNQSYIELFMTESKTPRKLKAYFAYKNQKKIPLVFHEKPAEYDGVRLSCEDFW